jgi:3-hydroxybutyryl-CoA dehydrogenase
VSRPAAESARAATSSPTARAADETADRARAGAADSPVGSQAAAVRVVGVVGAGTMGNGIAHVFAAAGRRVRLVDTDAAALGRALETIGRNLERQSRKGALAGTAAEVMGRIEGTGALEALAGSDLVVEAIVEDVEAKRLLFRRLTEIVPPRAVLASNTSAISITALGAASRRADRVVGMHFMNPVPLMPLVEVVRGVETSAATLELVHALCRDLGKTPVAVHDSPGFVSNRVLMPMINEAIFCLAEGVADARAVDDVMKLGMRHPMGPLELADLIGLDVCLAILQVLHRELGEDKYRPCPLLARSVAAGHLGRKSGRGFYIYGDADA